MAEKELEKLEGTVGTIVFNSEDTGFTVLELETETELVTVVGSFPSIAAGEEVVLTGIYKNHPTYGRQFSAEICERTLPATASAIYKYLASGAIKGVGPRTARRFVDEFGDDTLEVIEKKPELLSKIPRISKEKAMDIHDQYKHIFGIRSVMISLAKYGIEAAEAIRVWKNWGTMASEIIEKNPYQLCDPGIGISFDKADDIAKKLELSDDSPIRARAGILHVLNRNVYNGHTCLPEHRLVPTSAAMLGIDEMIVEDALHYCLEESILVSDTVDDVCYIYLPDMYESETYIAGRIKLLLNNPIITVDSYKNEIDALEMELGIEYAELQRRAIAMAMEQDIFILTGGPGTGKTTALNGILNLLDQKGEKTLLAAPTGRAAQRMSEVCGRESKTIHRLLEVDFTQPDSEHIVFKRNEKNPLRADAIILDEVSMIDTKLMHSLMKAMPLGCRLILVGDPDQLPSVGAGNVLGDLIESDVIPTVHLSEIFRQARQSQIVISSHEIVKGDYPDLNIRDSDFFFLRKSSYESSLFTTLQLCQKRLPAAYGYSPLWDIQVIAPSRVGQLGTVELNRHLQNHLNPPSRNSTEYKYGGVVFREKDKIMQIRNNYDIVWTKDDGEEGTGVFNGDIGIIEMIDRPSQSILIRYDDRVAEYTFDMANEIEHAYAITVHKSQGSEFPAVVIPLMNIHPKLYYRNILYTAVTRAKELMIILGQERTVGQMIENNRRVLRYTNLTTFLTDSVLG